MFRKTSIIVIIFFILTASASIKIPHDNVLIKETVIAGSKDKFMEIRHVVLRGTNHQIGKAIAELAIRNHGYQLSQLPDKLTAKVQKQYIERNYPILFERMRGSADAFGKDLRSDPYDFSSFNYNMGPMGCSVVYYPPGFTENGSGILSRNFDFTTGTIIGKRAKESELPVISRPYVFEIYPDRGYASLYICAFDLMSGVLDGMNSEGLTLSILADNPMGNQLPYEPSMSPQIGLNELQIMRFLLDNCSNVMEAKEALLSLKQYYYFTSLHYIVADRSGKSFVFEYSPSRNKSHIIDGQGPQCITNHLLYKYKSPEDSPAIQESFDRYNKLNNATQKSKFSIDEIKRINELVSGNKYSFHDQTWVPTRTLWHSIYNQKEKTLEVKFYLGEKTDPNDDTKGLFETTDYIKFHLGNNKHKSNQ